MKTIRIATALATAAALAVLSTGTVSGQAGQGLVVVESFDAAQQELPEGLSIGSQGDMYVTMGYPFFWAPGDGWLKHIDADGTKTTLAHFPDGQGPAGIVVADGGDVYFARANPEDEESRGVWHLASDGTTERLPGTEQMLVPNGLAFDGRGGLLVGDSALGIVWRVALDGSGAVEPWFSEATLVGGCGGDEMGVNGVALGEDSVYAANTDRGLLVRIPVLEDGSAGTGEVIAGDNTNECEPDALWGMDGIALDVDGNVFALLVMQNQLVRIDPSDGSFEVLATEADGLFNPSSLAFGTTEGDTSSLYFVNYAVIEPGPEGNLGPAILKLDVGVDGRPLAS